MGVLIEFLIMDTEAGHGHGSSGKAMNQYMVKDHMLSHYRRLYSAKAAVDCSVPKSMQCNVKYVDQRRREQMKKDTLSRSGRSDSQRSSRLNSRASCSSHNSRASIQGHYTAYHHRDHSVMSSPRINTSFHSKQIVYPSQTVRTSGSAADHLRNCSELHGYRSPNAYSGHLSSVSQRQFKSFQDPTQKTYSGDVLLKHADRFTQEKPFTPRTLKSNYKSTLLQYRYYTPPKRKDEEQRSSCFHMSRQDSSQPKPGFSPQLDSPQAFSDIHEWSDEESDSFRPHTTADCLLSSSRISPEGMKSPIMRKVSAEEEELMYLEFITDVTNEILAQGLYSDRVLKRVFERHIDMHRHRLDENKMRHLLDNLHKDLQNPSDAPVSFLSIDESENPFKVQDRSSIFSRELPPVPTDDAGFIPHTVFAEVRGQIENITSTPMNGNLVESYSPLHVEKSENETLNLDAGCEISPTDNNDLRDTSDDKELLEEVNKVEKSMRDLLNVSETGKSQTEKEQTTDILSDDEF